MKSNEVVAMSEHIDVDSAFNPERRNAQASIDVDAAFNPELRAAQANFNAYILDRYTSGTELPAEGAETNTPLTLPTDESLVGQFVVASEAVAKDTKTPDTSVVRPRAQSKIDRIGMIYNDVHDNQDWMIPPYAAEYHGTETTKLVERLLPEEDASSIRHLRLNYEDGHMYRQILHVGKRDNGDFHPHYYFIDRTRTGVTRLYFVDAEHKVAKKNFIKPPIANLVGIEVPDKEDAVPQVAIIRCRVPKYSYKQKPEGMKPEELRTVIEQVLDRNGGLPDRLSGSSERQMLFMIAANADSSRVQARYSSNRQIDHFARAEKGSKALEGKVWVQAYVVATLIKLFSDPTKARKVT